MPRKIGCITTYLKSDGSERYSAVIMRDGDKDSKTFDDKAFAQKWLNKKHREVVKRRLKEKEEAKAKANVSLQDKEVVHLKEKNEFLNRINEINMRIINIHSMAVKNREMMEQLIDSTKKV